MKSNIKVLPVAILAATIVFYSCESKNTADTSETKTEETAQAETAPEAAEPWMKQEGYSNVPAPVQQAVSGMLTNYLTLKDALVEANAEKAAKAAREMSDAIAKVPANKLPEEQQQFYKAHAQEVRQQAEAITSSTDMEAQRAKLNDLTQHVYALAKAYGGTTTELYLQHCPMARNNEGGYWLSSMEAIRNPYFGDKMLKCGETKMKL